MAMEKLSLKLNVKSTRNYLCETSVLLSKKLLRNVTLLIIPYAWCLGLPLFYLSIFWGITWQNNGQEDTLLKVACPGTYSTEDALSDSDMGYFQGKCESSLCTDYLYAVLSKFAFFTQRSERMRYCLYLRLLPVSAVTDRMIDSIRRSPRDCDCIIPLAIHYGVMM